MKKLCIMLLFTIVLASSYANIPMDEFVVIDNCNNNTIELGDHLSTVFELYPNIVFKGERHYSNMSYKEYQGDGIVFSISAYTDSDEEEKNANVLIMEISSNRYATKKGFTIGSRKEEIISQYGEAEYIYDNAYYYFNHEGDVLALMFRFNEEGFVDFIELSAGT